LAFITFEGIEGSGKSTLLMRVATRLGDRVVTTREPGGTAVGRALRDVLLSRASEGLTPMAELLLYFADRAQNVAEVVKPGLAAGKVVLCDRYVESSLAYQAYGRGLSREAVKALAVLATGGLRPDLIVLLDLPVEEGLSRVGRRGGRDRFESEDRAFHERVRQGYRELMAEEPERWLRLDATADPGVVSSTLWDAMAERGFVGDGANE
jgi:dTMP kinase